MRTIIGNKYEFPTSPLIGFTAYCRNLMFLTILSVFIGLNRSINFFSPFEFLNTAAISPTFLFGV